MRASKRRKGLTLNYENYDEDNDYSTSETDSYAPDTPDKPTASRRSTRLSNGNNTNTAGSSKGPRRNSKRAADPQSSDPIDLITESAPATPAQSNHTMLRIRLEARKHKLSLPDTRVASSSSSNSSTTSRAARSLPEEPHSIGFTRRKRQTLTPEPERDEYDNLIFSDAPNFRPNLTPKEMLELGSFGGTAFKYDLSNIFTTPF